MGEGEGEDMADDKKEDIDERKSVERPIIEKGAEEKRKKRET